MIRLSSALAVAIATILVCCNAESRQERDVSPDRLNDAGLKQQSLARQSREAHRISRNFGRHYEYLSPFGTRSLAPFEYGYYGEGLPKRNFDEIDRSNLDTFVKKRNFDEIDQSSMPFPYKRYINYVDSPYDNSIRQGGMDEIDLSSFPLNVIGMPPRRGH
ncbi:unnamed protein product [Leptidea sinapis]|uniref:Orcokinin n=1 Tax=Leptidea sinapis TaxID=189913 RepID=A0A5E4Q1N6_9NEOP|nr:unnamed protein product [Leptidea sinapis]